MADTSRQTIAGRHAVLAALASDRVVHNVLVCPEGDSEEVRRAASRRGVPVRHITPHQLTGMSGLHRHQGVGAVVDPLPNHSVRELVERARRAGQEPFIVAVDGVEDPQNVGAIARSALLAGCHGIIVPEKGTARLGPGAFNASSGALSLLAVAEVSSLGGALASLRRENLLLVGGDAASGRAPWDVDLRGPVCLVVGSESEGLSRAALDAVDARVCIPTPGGGLSLNVSAAAAVLLFERVRQVQAR